MSKLNVRELEAAVKPEGFRYVGLDGADHHVFATDDGLVIRTPNTGRADTATWVKRLKSSARRTKRAEASVSQEWVRWVRNRFKVPVRGEVEASFVLTELWDEFRTEKGLTKKVSRNTPYMALVQNGQVLVEKGSGGHRYGAGPATYRPSVWRLRGPLFGVNGVDPEPLAVETPIQVVETTLHRDALAKLEAAQTTTEGESGDVVRDPVDSGESDPAAGVPSPAVGDSQAGHAGGEGAAADPPAERGDAPVGVGAGGLNLPPDLVEALQDALSGDLRAENEILREQVREASLTVSRAAQMLLAVGLALDEALTLAPEAKPSERRSEPGRHNRPYHYQMTREEILASTYKPNRNYKGLAKPSNLGMLRLNDLRRLKEAGLPTPFHVDDAKRVLSDRDGHSVLSTMQAFYRHGIVKRHVRGWYSWAE